MNAPNPLDWLLALLLVYSTTRAALRGFFAEAFALGGLVLGFLSACWFYHPAALHLAGLITSAPLAQLTAFLLILVGTMVLAGLCGKVLRKTASAVGLGFFDRLGGALFGLLRGALLALSFIMALTAFLPAAPWVQGSQLAPYLLRGTRAVSFIMPEHLRLRVTEGLQHLKHTTPDWIKSLPSSQTR